MFIDTIPNRKSPPAVLLRESYREGGRVKKRTLANLSKLPQALIAGIAALLDGGKVSGKRAAEPGFEIVRSLPHGHVAAVQAMIRKLGLERTLQGGTGVDKLKRRFKLSHVALVGDRGMITSARITEELAPAGLDWISCLRAPQIAALAADTGPLQFSLFDPSSTVRFTK